MKVVEKEAGRQNVSIREVGLDLGNVSDAPDVVTVLLGRESCVDQLGVFTFEGVVVPDSVLQDRA